jgi:uncharacterized integral membrane protein
MHADDVSAVESVVTSPAPVAMRSDAQEKSARHTRTSGAWVSIALGLAALVVVLVFAMQNLSTVEVTFLSLHWTPPLAVMLLVASALGGVVVFAFGAARIGQLRIQARRARRRSTAEHD